MFGNIELFRLSQAVATHASSRLSLISQNVAHADTPGYRGKDIGSFSSLVREVGPQTDMRRSRAGHFASGSGVGTVRIDESAAVSPNGNSVSVEKELLKAAEVHQQHDRALAVYKSAMTILRTSIGRR